MPNQSWKEWVSSRPESVQNLISKYPPGEYLILHGAPYGISTPGTKVTLHSYGEDGTIGVVVRAEDKSPEALEHERMLAIQYNKLDQLEEFHKSDVKVMIDPQWMELISAAEINED